MSGHSKWATTKHKKAIIDSKRSKVFTKVAKLVTIAARDGKSGDPVMNPSLRLAIDNAKAVSMPKDNIDRAIKRGLGGLDGGAQLEEIIYEAYAPGGVALLIECLTDNKNRALGEIRALLNKAGGSLAATGSVSYSFKKVGQIIVDQSINSSKGDELDMIIIDSGAEDFTREEDLVVITCAFTEINHVNAALRDAGVKVDSSEVVYTPNTFLDISEDKKISVENLIEAIDDLDDVNSVYTNADL